MQNSKNDNSKERILIELHKTYAQDFQKIEQNYIELIVAVISAISIYGYGVKEFLYKVGECSEQAFILFTITTFGTNILLLIVYFVSNIKGYQARQLQIIVSQIENALGIVRYNAFDSKNKVIPKKWDPCEEEVKDKNKKLIHKTYKRKEYISPPDIYQFFKFVSFCLLVGGDLIYWVLLCHYQFGLKSFTQIFSIKELSIKELFFIISILLLLLGSLIKFRWGFPIKLPKPKSYSEKLKELCEYWFSENEENDNQDC